MVNIQEFVRYWSNKEENTHQRAMCEAYSDAEKSIEAEHSKLLRYLEPQKQENGKVFAVFNPSILGWIDDYNSMLSHFKAIEADIESYLKLSGGEVSITSLAEKIHRLQRRADIAEHDARISVANAIKNSNISIIDAQNDEKIQKLYDVRDRIKEEVSGELETLKQRLKDANIILAKYN